jgi:hypothetical protein
MDLVEMFLNKPDRLGYGAGKLARQFKVSKEDVIKAKALAKDLIHGVEKANLQNIISEQENVISLLSEKVENENKIVELSSLRPLSKEEIELHFSIDNVSSKLSSYWNKQLPNGKYIVSANIKCIVSDFYSENQLREKLASMYSNISSVTLPEVVVPKGEALFIYIADDHSGLSFNSSLFNNSWNKEIYLQRMTKIVKKAISFGRKFETVVIVRLGDEADGWNGKTTRQDHSLGSLSNKDQFDIFTEVNNQFYDMMFSSELSNEYLVVTCNNSNHSGSGLSYILHKSTEFYVQARYPEVMFLPINEFISGIEWGNHIIGLTHGKDEKFMKSPMPLNLDVKTDLWLYDYYDHKGYSPNKKWVSTIKGDIHKFNINDGKSGRYVNVPSICGSSEWIEHNFGNTKPGAVIELYEKDSPDITTINLRF